MFARTLAMLALLAIVVVTSLAPAHAMRMGAAPDHSMHAGEIAPSAVQGERPCSGQQGCSSQDDDMCAFVCAGLPAFLVVPEAGTAHVHFSAMHGFPVAEPLTSRSPGLNERPPRTRHL